MMQYPSIFDQSTLDENFKRLESLTSNTQPLWGKMNVAQMLAHLNVAYQLGTGEVQVKVNPIAKIFFKLLIKPTVVGNKPYKQNGHTAPYFLIVDERQFEVEKEKLKQYMIGVFDKGVSFYEGLDNRSFGKLSSGEWSNLYQKHFDHHMKQFGV